MTQSVINAYAEDAHFLIQSFEAISADDVLSHIVDFIPKTTGKIIEIGAGTGRDAAWLASKGWGVLAVEPVSEFRQAGQSLHPSPLIEWCNDSLPFLSRILQRNEQYELALLVSVWQHVPKEAKLTSLTNLHSILQKEGRLILSVRNGPGSITRKCYPTSAKETVDIAQLCGFQLLSSQRVPSVQIGNQQAQVTWTWLVFTAV